MSLESKEAKLVAKYRQCLLVLEQEVEAEAYGDGSVSTIEKTTGTSENTNETPVEREMVEM